MDLVALLFQQERVEQFLDNICSRGNRSESAGFSDSFYHLAVFVFHVFYRIFHRRKQCCLGKTWRRRGFPFPDIHPHLFHFHSLADLWKRLIFEIPGAIFFILRIQFLHLTESLVDHDFSSGNKLFTRALCIDHRLFISARRIENT